jgi:CRISPR-associated protein Cmr1
MRSLRLTLETVTPMFLGGAEQQPELRPASVRGALRYWLRAVSGGVIGDGDLGKLHELESNVFGATDHGSSVSVRLLDQVGEGAVTELRQPGIAYLWFSMSGRGTADRKAIPAGKVFRLCLQQGIGSADVLPRATEALWLLTHLGGLGARSRRGAGSLATKSNDCLAWPGNIPRPITDAETPPDLCNALGSALKQIRTNIESYCRVAPLAKLPLPSFDALHPDCCKVWVLDKAFESWQDALTTVGLAMQDFRFRFHKGRHTGVPDDYANVRAALSGGRLSQPVQRAAFGLPIVFYFRSLGGAKDTLEGEEHERRSSPLHIRVSKLAGQNGVGVVLTVFYSQLLSPGEKTRLKRQGSKTVTPGWNALDLFLRHLDSNVAKTLPVKY